MQINKKIIYPTFAILAVASLTLAVSMNFSVLPSVISTEPASYSGIGCVEVTRADGSKEPIQCSHNQLTNMGKNMTRDYLLGGATLSAIDAIGVGQTNDSQVATETVLAGEWDGCGLERATAGGKGIAGHTTQTAGNWTVYKAFTSTCDGMLVNGTGLYNNTAGAFMFAQANFTAATLQTNDIINVSWFVWVT